MSVKPLTTNPSGPNVQPVIAADPSFTQLFQNPNDPRIEFFGRRLHSHELALLAQLHTMVFQGTPLSNQKIAPYEITLTLDYPSVRRVESPSRDSSIFDEIALRFLSENHEKNCIWGSPLFKKAGHAQLLCSTVLCIVLLKLFWESAGQLDDQQNQIIQSRIQNGTCELVKGGCKDLFSRTDCYRPLDKCTFMGSRHFLVSSIICIMYATAVNMSLRRCNRDCEVTGAEAEFNDPGHDAFLDSLCRQNGTSPQHWSNLIEVNGQTCTLRTLVLLFLSSCNEQLYEKIFSDILPTLATNQEILLRFGDYEMRLKGSNDNRFLHFV